MNKHLKLAILIAPLLIIIGYVASDYYIQQQASKPQLFMLNTVGQCDILNHGCVLTSGEFSLELSDIEGQTKIKSAYPLEAITFFIVDKSHQTEVYQLKSQTDFDWYAKTSLRNRMNNSSLPQTLRIIAQINNHQYISEFQAVASY